LILVILYNTRNLLKKYAEENIERAKRNADFAGRKTLLEEDL
jgi:histone H3/H4